jgi:NAD(P)-dependent dehydrogenase (short-subunit alcohol dehydrogenase family)
MKNLSGKAAVVTGAASGIGKAMALRFAAAGMNVVLADLDEGRLAEVRDEVRALKVGSLIVPTDVRKIDSVTALADQAISTFGQVNVLCNNAGVASKFLGGQIDLPDWRWVMDVNFWGVVHGHHAFLPHMLEHGDAHIVNTASMAGHFPSHSPYGASKWAVVGITEGLFHMLAEQRSTVGVSCLCPGWVKTNIAKSVANRPEDVAPGPRLEENPEDEARYAFVAELIENGLAPEAVADKVLLAIEEKQFWIFTHPEMVAVLPSRFDAIMTNTNPTRAVL